MSFNACYPGRVRLPYNSPTTVLLTSCVTFNVALEVASPSFNKSTTHLYPGNTCITNLGYLMSYPFVCSPSRAQVHPVSLLFSLPFLTLSFYFVRFTMTFGTVSRLFSPPPPHVPPLAFTSCFRRLTHFIPDFLFTFRPLRCLSAPSTSLYCLSVYKVSG